jgi:hypothetical protein
VTMVSAPAARAHSRIRLSASSSRTTLPAAAVLLDSGLHAGRGHAGLPGSARAVALELAPALFLAVTAQRLAKNLGLGATFLPRQALSLTDQIQRERQRADSRGRAGTVACSCAVVRPWFDSTHAVHSRQCAVEDTASTSPRLLESRARSIDQMRLINALCRFAEMAASGP